MEPKGARPQNVLLYSHSNNGAKNYEENKKFKQQNPTAISRREAVMEDQRKW